MSGIKSFQSWWDENFPNGTLAEQVAAHYAWCAALQAATDFIEQKPKAPTQPDTDDWIKIRKEGGLMESGRAKDMGIL